jgi:hypothetical protein
MANKIDNQELARELFWRTLSRYRCNELQITQINEAVNSLPPDLRRQFDEAEGAFFVALSFRSRFFGALWRRSQTISVQAASLAAGQISMDASSRPTGPHTGLRLIKLSRAA